MNLGTNDINGGDPGTPFETAYTGLLAAARAKYPGALIVCIIGPLLSGTELSTMQAHILASVNARIAAGDHDVEFFDQIATQTSDKEACQYHPTRPRRVDHGQPDRRRAARPARLVRAPQPSSIEISVEL